MSAGQTNKKPAIVLLSGGMDSVTVLALAKAEGFDIYALSFSYGQRHSAELTAARHNASQFKVAAHKTIEIDLQQFGGSALTDHSIDVPVNPSEAIPVTYVPARNTLFLSYALAWAEVLQARDIYIGVNAVDYSGYPDCRPEFIQAFSDMANLATKAAVQGNSMSIHTPLINLSKAQIIQLGVKHGVDYSRTVSCYQASDTGLACGACDACRLRKQGFIEAGIPDNTAYQSE
ncbi:MAG: 7-cyano-7-deazaguanine synthase QueC [Gammaproteobacteria bacterium]|nr:7-cyano-7-deazaguanine synthase QueC [Gammaproteobacteria bacterium]NNC97173.1 7-cyano-7-deazaguanine synthase QueC [Gammaproteobacteria bacterium]NNM13634.1 7-cyano-7-deazaguanine synthase QueC [Gammaproteobacteria bacterium]